MALSYPDLVPGLRDWMPMGSDTRRIVWALLGVLSLPVMLWAGSQFFTGMWDALKHRAANMHTLIAIGISAAFAYSVVTVAWPQIFLQMALAEVFWDGTDVVGTLVVLGLTLEIQAKGRTPQAIKKLIGLQAKTCPRCSTGFRASEIAGGYQEAMILVKGGYTRDIIIVRSGRPVRLNFRREETASCSDNVIFADFQKSTELPTGQTVPV